MTSEGGDIHLIAARSAYFGSAYEILEFSIVHGLHFSAPGLRPNIHAQATGQEVDALKPFGANIQIQLTLLILFHPIGKNTSSISFVDPLIPPPNLGSSR